MGVDLIERGGFVSDELVDRMALDQRDRLLGHDPTPTLGVVLGYPTDANISYGLQVLTHGERLTGPGEDAVAPVELYIPTADGFELVRTVEGLREAKERGLYVPVSQEDGARHDDNIVGLVQDMNGRPDIFGILPLLRSATGDGDKAIRAAIDPQKDPDGISPNRVYTPATPESQVVFAEYITGEALSGIDPRTIGIIGNGPLVGGPLYKEVLPAHGVDTSQLGAMLGTRAEIEAGVPRLNERNYGAGERDLRVIFTAIPVGALIRKEYLNDGVVIIDAGFGTNPETKEPSGNVHPELLALNGLRGNVITSFRRGVGPVTAAVIYDRIIPPRHPDDDRRLQLVGAGA